MKKLFMTCGFISGFYFLANTAFSHEIVYCPSAKSFMNLINVQSPKSLISQFYLNVGPAKIRFPIAVNINLIQGNGWKFYSAGWYKPKASSKFIVRCVYRRPVPLNGYGSIEYSPYAFTAKNQFYPANKNWERYDNNHFLCQQNNASACPLFVQ